MTRKLKIAVIGAGQFSQCFVPLYRAHPLVEEVSLAEVFPERLREQADLLEVSRRFSSFEEALRSDVDAVAIFTQRWNHAPLAMEALRAGKHVYCAVPAAATVEEMEELAATVARTGLVYMMGETSLYYGARLYCRERFERGDFGRFVYGEGEYYHDMSHGFYEAFQHSGGEKWKSQAGYPPMLYPTHSVAMILSVTGARMTHVSCLGQVDQHEDGVFQPEANLWKNPFSNQSALFRTSDGGMARVNEFRRVGVGNGRSVRLSLYGTEAAFEEQADGAHWTTRDHQGLSVEDQLQCGGVTTHEAWEKIKVDAALKGDFVSGFAQVHRKYRERLPQEYRTQPNGHEGSHQFLTDDFIQACVRGTRPSCDVWDAARYNLPGIVAHQSALREGELLPIPHLERPSACP